MNVLLEQHSDRIAALCRQYGVKRLELFGSATTSDFNASTSDFDLFYEFESQDFNGMADRFFGLLSGLEQLFGRHVDLASLKDATNPYFIESATLKTVLLYAA